MGKSCIVFPAQVQGCPERHPYSPGSRHLPRRVEDAIHAIEPDRYDRDVESGRNHPYSAAKGFDVARFPADAFRENQDGPSVSRELPHVPKGLTRADLTLRNREPVEVKTRQAVVQR